MSSKPSTFLPLPLAPAPSLAPAELCPFHDGAATLDTLLAELDPRDRALFDATLDLRSLLAAGNDALACAEQLFRVRALLSERHYLAFYRVRCWLRRALCIQVRAHRQAAWQTRDFPLNGARLDEVVNCALATLVCDSNEVVPATAHVRFVFAGRR